MIKQDMHPFIVPMKFDVELLMFVFNMRNPIFIPRIQCGKRAASEEVVSGSIEFPNFFSCDSIQAMAGCRFNGDTFERMIHSLVLQSTASIHSVKDLQKKLSSVECTAGFSPVHRRDCPLFV